VAEVCDPEVYDIAVVGAGPAGSAAALSVLRACPDARVALVDAAAFPRDKPCGDGIAPHAVEVLRDLHVPDATAGYLPLHGMRLRSPGGVELSIPLARPAWAIPRRVFDARLHAAACARGAVPVRHRVRNLHMRPGERLVTLDREIAARVVIGADGAYSAVRRALRIPRNPPHALAVAVRGYARLADAEPAPAEMLIEMVAQGWPAYGWSFPIGDGTANVGYGELRSALGTAGPGKAHLHRSLSTLLPDQPPEAGSLRAHHLPLSTSRPRQPDGPVLLVGDAASLVNPLTGEGIYYAVLSGMLAGDAAAAAVTGRAADPGALYRAALRRELGRHLRHTGTIGRLARNRPQLMDTTARVARGRPKLLDGLTELGLGRGTVRLRSVTHVTVAGLTSSARRASGARNSLWRRESRRMD
jgi:geranylgeranyl reductase family protein